MAFGRRVVRHPELEQLLRRQVGSQDSELGKTLASHFGVDSPLMKVLSPDQSRGLLASPMSVKLPSCWVPAMRWPW
jgi:hypothetical protein